MESYILPEVEKKRSRDRYRFGFDCPRVNQLDSKLAPEGPLQHRRQERVQLGGGLRLVALEGVEL